MNREHEIGCPSLRGTEPYPNPCLCAESKPNNVVHLDLFQVLRLVKHAIERGMPERALPLIDDVLSQEPK